MVPFGNLYVLSISVQIYYSISIVILPIEEISRQYID